MTNTSYFESIEMKEFMMSSALRGRPLDRDEVGATTAEYAVCTGAAVGFAGLMFKLLTTGAGQAFLSDVWTRMTGMLPF